MTGRLAEFSAGYYSIDLRATPYDEGPVVDTHLYEYLTQKLYANTNTPVWMRADFGESPYFKLDHGEPMPHDVIGLPASWMQDFDMADDNRTRPMYVCKPSHAHYLEQSSLLGSWVNEGDD